MPKKTTSKQPKDPVLARTHSTGPSSQPANSSSPTPSQSQSGIEYGTPCKKVSDMSETDITWILPKADYRNACYMWMVPNGEIVIPGKNLYRMPTTQKVMTTFYGFMPEDTLEDFGVFGVPTCSDWEAYVAKRQAGEWAQEESAIQQLIASEGADVSGVPPEGANVAGWEDIASVTVGWYLLPNAENVIPLLGTSESDAMLADIKANGASYLSSLAPSLPSSFVQGTDFSDPGNLITELKLGTIELTSPSQMEEIPAFSKVPLSVLQEMGGNTYSGTAMFDMQPNIFTGSATIDGYALSTSNCRMQCMFSGVTLRTS